MSELSKPELLVMRGLPGSGKSTFAKGWVSGDPYRRVRINRDEMREMLQPGQVSEGQLPGLEADLSRACDAAISAFLKKGVSVVVDNMNLKAKYVKALRKLAQSCNAGFSIEDMTHVDVNVCIARDNRRDRNVGEDVIRDLHRRFVQGRAYPLPLEDDQAEIIQYVPDTSKPKAFIVDVDGTVALMRDRYPYDWDKVHTDDPNLPVIAVVKSLKVSGHKIIFLSGRDSCCRYQTNKWLRNHIIPNGDYQLFMRKEGDMRDDRIVKQELFDRHVRDRYNVIAVLDDRNKVVEFWRSVGLPCFQVAPGDF